MKVLVTLGYFDATGEGRLVSLDLDSGEVLTLLSYVPPEPLKVTAKGFTGACWLGSPGSSPLLVCGHAALFLVEVQSSPWRVTQLWHHSAMNDLHHVAASLARIFVVNTGLEAVEVFSHQGVCLGSIQLHPAWISTQRQLGWSPERDALEMARSAVWPPSTSETFPTTTPSDTSYYSAAEPSEPLEPFHRRKVRDYFHPNHVCVTERQLLVTRLLDRSVWDLHTLSPVIMDTPGLPHDGQLLDDLFWLTCVNGLIVAYAVEGDRVTGREVERYDVFALTGHTGWCRGLLVTSDLLVVGLTEIRPGRMPRQRWCDRPFELTETSVLCLDRSSGRLLSRIDLTDAQRHAKLFSILPMT